MKRLIYLLWLLLLAFSVQAQEVTVSGRIVDSKTSESLYGANIYARQLRKGETSDGQGRFKLLLPKGRKVELVISYVGYQSQTLQLQLQNDTVLNIRLKQDNRLPEVDVYADQISGIGTSQMSAIEMPIEEVKKLPMLFGEVDVMKAIQKLPGVQSAGDGQAGIYVRGGNYDQNQITLDGATIYNAEHLKGFVSAINPDLVKDLAFYKGAFPARYGGQLSSVVDVSIREGNTQTYRGELSLGMLSSKLAVEGPIWKDRTSFHVGGRLSYLDKIVLPLLESVADNEKAMSPYTNLNYYDLTAKLTHRFSDKSRLSALFYAGHDTNDVSPNQNETKNDNPDNNRKQISKAGTENNWGNLITNLRWTYQPNGHFLMNTGLNYSSYHYNLKHKDYQYSETSLDGKLTAQQIQDAYVLSHSDIDEVSLNMDFLLTPNKRHHLRWGAKASYQTFHPSIRVFEENYKKELKITDYEEWTSKTDTVLGNGKQKLAVAALYLEDDWELTRRLKVNAGLRYALFAVPEKNYHSLEPRFSLRWLLCDDMALKLSYAHMAQGIHLLSSTNLVMPSDIWISIDKDIPVTKSNQWAVGYNYEIEKGFNLSIEGFYKQMDNLLEYREGYSTKSPADSWRDKIVTGEGESYGVELFLQKNTGNTTGWIGYTWSKSLRLFDRPSEELFSSQKFYAGNDRRHNLNIVANHRFNEHWEVSLAWNYQTGRRGTLSTTTFYAGSSSDPSISPNFSNDLIIGQVAVARPEEQQNTLSILRFLPIVRSYKERNGYQLPTVHRLDMGVTYTWKSGQWENKLNFSIYNVYNRHNVSNIYWGYENKKTVLKGVCLLPFLPSISYTVKL